jgi:hypothetical protein
MQTYKLASDPSLSGDLVPGWWVGPGVNRVQITATPKTAAGRSAQARLQLLPGTKLTLKTRERPPAMQLGLWPFPLYGKQAWSHTTLLTTAGLDLNTLSSLIGALANTERITGLPADPAVSYAAPTAAQLKGNVIAVSQPGHFISMSLGPTQPSLNGLLEEVQIPHGGIALFAYGPRSLAALGQGYNPTMLNGSAVLIDAAGHSRMLAPGRTVSMFKEPKWPWLAPAAFLALLAFGWLGVHGMRARRRLVELPELVVPTAKAGGAR